MSADPIGLVVAAVRSVLRAELGLTEGVRPITSPAGSAALTRPISQAVARHRVAILLAPHGESLGFAPTICADLREAHRAATLGAMATMADTIQVSATLAAAGVAHLMIKGVLLSQQTTGMPLARGSGDVDVVVDPDRVPAAVAALLDTGIRFDSTFCPAPDSPLYPATRRTQQELVLWNGAAEIDLHWRLDVARGCLSWRFDELVDAAELVQLNELSVPTLSRPAAALLNASQGARDGWSALRALVDQIRLLEGLDPDVTAGEARRVGAARRLEMAHQMTARLVGIDAPAGSSATAAALADRMWAWLLAGRSPGGRTGAGAAARSFAANVLTYDSPRAAAQRSQSLVWPVRAMAARSLGDVGDRRPWLYPAATPYFLSRRLLGKIGLVAPERRIRTGVP